MSPLNGISSIPVLHGFLGHYQLSAFPLLQLPCCQATFSAHLASCTSSYSFGPVHSSQVYLGWKEVYLEPSFLPLPPTAHPQGLKPGGLDVWTTFMPLEFFLFPLSLLFSCCPCLPPSPPCLSGKGCEKPPPPRWSKQVLLKE